MIVAGFADSIVDFRGDLIRHLVTLGHEVHVAAPLLSDSTDVAQELTRIGAVLHDISLDRTGLNLLADLRAMSGLRDLMKVVSPDIFFGYTIKPVIYGLIAAKRCGVSRRFALITGLGHAFISPRSVLVRYAVEWLYRLALPHASMIFFQNPDDAELFARRSLTGSGSRVQVVNGSGINVEHFKREPVPSGGIRFLMIARLLGDKGIREYAMAADRTRRKYSDAQFDLVGWIDANPDSIARSELDAWVQSGTINFLGRLKDVKPAINNCTVYVLPSYREGTPRTVLEAMAMGRPIITTDAPGCRETVIDGENGLLVAPKSVDELVAAMTKFLDEPEIADRMGRRSREIAEEKYDVHKVNATMLRGMGLSEA